MAEVSAEANDRVDQVVAKEQLRRLEKAIDKSGVSAKCTICSVQSFRSGQRG